MSAPADIFLARLEGVKPRQGGGWVALCPAHDDRSPSLSVSIGDDGRVLIYCFAGCGAGDVVAAVGLSLSDLFDQTHNNDHSGRQPRQRQRFTARDVVAVFDHERLVVAQIASAVAGGAVPTDDDLARLALAGERLERLKDLAL